MYRGRVAIVVGFPLVDSHQQIRRICSQCLLCARNQRAVPVYASRRNSGELDRNEVFYLDEHRLLGVDVSGRAEHTAPRNADPPPSRYFASVFLAADGNNGCVMGQCATRWRACSGRLAEYADYDARTLCRWG